MMGIVAQVRNVSQKALGEGVLKIEIVLVDIGRVLMSGEILHGAGHRICLRLGDLTDRDGGHRVHAEHVLRDSLNIGNRIVHGDDLRNDGVLRVYVFLRGIVEAPAGADDRIGQKRRLVGEPDTRSKVGLGHVDRLPDLPGPAR